MSLAASGVAIGMSGAQAADVMPPAPPLSSEWMLVILALIAFVSLGFGGMLHGRVKLHAEAADAPPADKAEGAPGPRTGGGSLEHTQLDICSTLSSFTDLIVFTDLEQRIQYMNPAAEATFGHETSKIRGASAQILYASKSDFLKQTHLREDSAGRPRDIRYRRKDGMRFIGETSESQVADPRGQTGGYLSIIRDVTQRRTAEQTLQRRERYLHHLDQVSRVIAHHSDLNSMIKAVVREVLDIFRADRAWLINPCDPQAPSWHVVVEALGEHAPHDRGRTFDESTELVMTQGIAELMHEARDCGTALTYTGMNCPLDLNVAGDMHIKSHMYIALFPKIGAPWLLSLQQFSYQREWSNEDKRLFHDLTDRLKDTLTQHLLLQRLAEDITHREKVEEALQEREVRYHGIFQNAAISLWEEDYTSVKQALDALGEDGVVNFPAYFDEHPEYVRQLMNQVRILDVNHVTLRMFGATSKRELLTSLPKLILPESVEAFQKLLVAIADGERYFLSESLYRTLDDRTINVLIHLTLPGNARGFEHMPISFVDITHQKETEQKLGLAATVFENTAEGVCIADADLNVIAINRSFSEITGYDEVDVKGRPCHLFNSLREDWNLYNNLWSSIEQTGRWQGEATDFRKEGQAYPVWLTVSTITDEAGTITHYVTVFDDITAIKQSQEQLDHLAHHDPLTNLPNRLLFNDRLTQAIKRAHRGRTSLALLFLDLDRFKYVNDTQGHPVGDQLLKEVSERLKTCVREDDTVARLGGDEFTIILENLSGLEHLGIIARKILDALAVPFKLQGQEAFITASIGVSLYPEHGDDVTTLIKNADTAMYQAKDQGKNTYRIYEKELSESAFERYSLEGDLRRALKNEEFQLYYQPQVTCDTGQLLGAEALIRWQHPEHGLISPEKFIPVAEETGLMVPLGEWILQTACIQAATWAGLSKEKLRIAVNLSAGQVNARLLKIVPKILEACRLSPDLLELEITESLMMSKTEDNIKVLNKLNQSGIHISIDDFGTGYSSLSYLKRFPIDKVKIDRSFINDLASDPDDSAIVQTIIAMAKTLKLDVTAEGVETEDQRQILQGMQCDICQGYLFSKPLPPEEFERRFILSQQPVALPDANKPRHPHRHEASARKPRELQNPGT